MASADHQSHKRTSTENGVAASVGASDDVEQSLEELIVRLHSVEAVKFGEFKLKSGIMSPVYFDLRVIISYPDLLEQVSELLWKAAADKCSFDTVCGVPYTALPIATIMSVRHNRPMLLRRKEGSKDYGTRRIIEGRITAGESCLIVEDVVTSGGSVLDTAEVLRREDLVVRDAVVLMDREQGAAAALAAQGITVHRLLGLRQIIAVLERRGLVQTGTAVKVHEFLLENQLNPSASPSPRTAAAAVAAAAEERAATGEQGDVCACMPFGRRAELAAHPTAAALLRLMARKETCLAVAADVTSGAELLALAEAVGPHVAMFKTHADLVEDWTPALGAALRRAADKHDFLIMEDRKLADIGAVAGRQLTGGLHRIAAWAHLVTAHVVAGPGLLSGVAAALAGGAVDSTLGVVLVAEMSSEGTLATGEAYRAAAVDQAAQQPRLVAGFVCQSRVGRQPGLLRMTPGVRLEVRRDALGQQYTSPRAAVAELGADLVIVGRGVTQASDVAGAAVAYKKAAFDAYLARLDSAAELV